MDSEAGFRWSMKHAVVYLPGPAAPGQKLYLHGFLVDAQLKPGPLHIDVSIDGRSLSPKEIAGPATDFRLNYDLPPELVGREKMQVAFTVDRTIHPPGEVRDLGLAFGQFMIK